jgi:hypothetical protein
VTMITSEKLAAAFDEVAPRYDLMVALNPGYHAHLRAAANALMEWLPRPKIASSMRPEPVEGRQSHLYLLDLGCDPEHPPALCSALPEAADLRFAIRGHSPVMTARVLRSSLIDFLSRGCSTPCAGGAFLCAPR